MTVFVDTSGLYAVFDRDDRNDVRARGVWEKCLREETALVTNNYVMLETVALLQHRIGVAAVRALHEDVAPLLRVYWVSEEQHRARLEMLLLAGRRRLSLVDCVSFQTMRLLAVRTVFCFDAHFREQGFEIRP
jgi:predicted nucleic acid-binding protein